MNTETKKRISEYHKTLVSIQATELRIDPIFKKREDDFYKAIETAKEALLAILEEWDICINCHLNLIYDKETNLCCECFDELLESDL